MNVSKNDIENTDRVISLYKRSCAGDALSPDEYAWLGQQGFIKMYDDHAGLCKVSWQPVMLGSKKITEQLLAIGEKIKAKYKDAFDSIKEPYVEACLSSVPAHLRRLKEYELQFIFHSDGWFLLHCLVVLLENGKLKPPTEAQRKMLTTLIIQN